MNKIKKYSVIIILLVISFFPMFTNVVSAAEVCSCTEESLCNQLGGTIGGGCGTCDTGKVCCCYEKGWIDLIFGGILPSDLPGVGTSIKSVFKTIMTIAISLFGVGVVGVNLYGGYLWVTAGDNEEQLKKAQSVFKDGWIGIGIAGGFIIVLGLLAYVFGVNITDFTILDTLLS